MRVVITGATGNVGTSLVEALADDAAVDTIVGLARRAPAWAPPKTTWVTADVARDDLQPHLRGADAVVHLAWLFHPMRKPAVTGAANVHGSARVFRAAAAAGVRQLVYASSVGAYSPGPKDRAVDESWPTDGWPPAAYAREKAYVERLLDSFEHQHPEVRVVRLRPGFIFKRGSASQQRRLFGGPFLPTSLLRPGLVPLVPDFPGLRFQALHSADAADAYRRALLDDRARGAFNLAAEPVVDAAVLAALLGARTVPVPRRAVRAALAAAFRLRVLPVVPPLLDVLAHVPIMDVTRAHRELGWQPRHSAVAALHAVLDGMRASAGWPSPPLDPDAGGRFREREVSTGVGSRA
jgi:UDP-glucose 4-epimerase